jgi:TolB-like protein/DNA-binding winged helix-turn-helix (wHTH) protein/Tfp pilus assembly protein PilF
MPASRPFKVGDWVVEPDLDRISRGGNRIPLRPQVMRLLVYLAEREGQVARSEDLMRDLWSGKIVSDATLYNCVAELRSVLDKGRDGESAIKTVPKKGYSLKLPVSDIDTPESEAQGPVEEGRRAAPGFSRRYPWLVALGLAVAASAVLFVGSYSVSPEQGRAPGTADSNPSRDSVAVLPFKNLSSDPNDEYLSDGVATQILNALSRVDGLAVIASTSSFAFKGTDANIKEIGDLLGTMYVIEGSVFRSGDRLLITAQLVDTDTGFNVWSDKYDRGADDLIAIQEEIVRSVVAEWPGRLLNNAPVRTVRNPVGIDAYDLYLVALENRRNAMTGEQLLRVANLLDQVLQMEPDFVEALSLRAAIEIDLSDYGFGARVYTAAEALPRAKQWIDAAREQGGAAAEVLYALALYHDAQDEVPTAETLYSQALQLRPNYTEARVNLARTFLRESRFDEAIEELEGALQYDPANAAPNRMLFNQYLMMHRLPEAKAILDRQQRLDPYDPLITWNRAKYLLFAGRLAESLRLVESFLASEIEQDVREMFLRGRLHVLLALAENDRVLDESEQLTGAEAIRIKALILQGRQIDAVAAAERWLAEDPDSARPVDALLTSLFYAGLWTEYVTVFERHFHHVSFFRDLEYLPAGSMALGPYEAAGHRRYDMFESVAWEVLENGDKRGAAWAVLDVYAARLLVLAGREDEAITRLRLAVEKGYFSPWIPIDPVIGRLSAREDYIALLGDIEQRVNEQRAQLGLSGVKLTRAISSVQTPLEGN